MATRTQDPDRLKSPGVFSAAFDPIAGDEWRNAAAQLAAFSKNVSNQPSRFIQGLNITR
jgi:hypothetical protein